MYGPLSRRAERQLSFLVIPFQGEHLWHVAAGAARERTFSDTSGAQNENDGTCGPRPILPADLRDPHRGTEDVRYCVVQMLSVAGVVDRPKDTAECFRVPTSSI